VRTLRIGDRHLVLVTGTQLEQWTYEQALLWLREAAAHWVGREALLRLSDRTLGPDDDLDAAIVHLARLVDGGELVLVREDRRESAMSARTDDGRWDAPRLVDLRRDRPSNGTDERRARRDTPTTPPPDPPPRQPNDRPTDTWTTFVAYAVFDQHGNPLQGRSRCIVDGATHERSLTGDPIEVHPIGAHARVVLELEALTSNAAPA
jgi:hypothetical protein